MRFSWRVTIWALVSLVVLPGSILAASEAETVISACEQRTGLSAENCISFIKKYMNVDRCRQYTKLSADECEKKLAALRESPEFKGSGTTQSTQNTSSLPSSAPSHSGPVSPTTPDSNLPLKDQVLIIKQNKEQRFLLIEEETKKVIEYIHQQGQDTALLESKLAHFHEQKDAVLSAYDQYLALAALPRERRPVLDAPKSLVNSVLRDAVLSYRSDLLPALRQALKEIHQP